MLKVSPVDLKMVGLSVFIVYHSVGQDTADLLTTLPYASSPRNRRSISLFQVTVQLQKAGTQQDIGTSICFHENNKRATLHLLAPHGAIYRPNARVIFHYFR